MKTKFSLLFAIVFSLATMAQKWTNYNTANTSTQLYNNNVFAIAVDKDGSVWFGNVGGVTKFDGTKWTTYAINGMTNNCVISINLMALTGQYIRPWMDCPEIGSMQLL